MYSIFARCYDRVMSDVPYAEWATYITVLFNSYHMCTSVILDIGGGTGILAAALSGMGYRVDILDKSKAMLDEAKKKNYKIMPSFFCADILTQSPRGLWDTVLCLHDTINYFHTQEQLKIFFSNTAAVLPENGFLIVDNCTEYNILTNFSGKTYYDTYEDMGYIWENSYNPETRTVTITMHFTGTKTETPVYCEKHTHVLHTEKTLRECADPFFSCVDVLHGFSLRKTATDTEEEYYIFKRKSVKE